MTFDSILSLVKKIFGFISVASAILHIKKLKKKCKNGFTF